VDEGQRGRGGRRTRRRGDDDNRQLVSLLPILCVTVHPCTRQMLRTLARTASRHSSHLAARSSPRLAAAAAVLPRTFTASPAPSRLAQRAFTLLSLYSSLDNRQS